jgi:hypothetical protein
MPLTGALDKSALDWVLGGAAPARPGGRWLSFATGSPNANGASDGAATPRCTVTFAAANSPQNSVTNLNAISATVSGAAAQTFLGWNLYDSSAGGVRLAYGTCTAAIGCKSGDNPSLSAGALKLTLS